MNDNHDRQSVYEIGYLIATSVAEEHVPAQVEAIKKILSGAGATILGEEAPHLQPLAYTMRRKTVSGSYDKFDEAYFGWVKFEADSDKIEAAKKAIENLPSVLRMLLITTVRENTYLGKRAASMMARTTAGIEEKGAVVPTRQADPIAAPATVEEMDKSIDEMVKEV